MPVSEAQKAANERYRKANVTQKTIRFYPSEAEELAWAMDQGNFAGYVKGLIRADMEARQAQGKDGTHGQA
jgi:hypothetical protein